MSHAVKPSNGNRGYEHADVKVGRLAAFGAGVALLVIFGVLVSDAVFHIFVRVEPEGPPATPFEMGRELPPGPRLQTYAPLDLQNYVADQNKILNSYGWVDSRAGIVRIPVQQAMDSLVQKGFPTRGNPANGMAQVRGEQPPFGAPLVAPTPQGGGEVR